MHPTAPICMTQSLTLPVILVWFTLLVYIFSQDCFAVLTTLWPYALFECMNLLKLFMKNSLTQCKLIWFGKWLTKKSLNTQWQGMHFKRIWKHKFCKIYCSMLTMVVPSWVQMYAPIYSYITGLFSNMFIKSIQRCCSYANNIDKLFVLEVNFINSLSSLISILMGKLHGYKIFNSIKSPSIAQNNT